MKEIELIEKAALKVGMTSRLNHGAASCVYSEGCHGVTQEHIVAFAREVALHCAAALAAPQQTDSCEDQYQQYLRNLNGAPVYPHEAFRAAWHRSQAGIAYR